MFDKPWYDALRKKYHAEYLPTIFDKVTVDLGRGGGRLKRPGGAGLCLCGHLGVCGHYGRPFRARIICSTERVYWRKPRSQRRLRRRNSVVGGLCPWPTERPRKAWYALYGFLVAVFFFFGRGHLSTHFLSLSPFLSLFPFWTNILGQKNRDTLCVLRV